MVGGVVAPEWVEVIAERTDGNPFFVHQIVEARLLMEIGGRGDRELGLSLLASVVATADSLGMRGLAGEARALVAGAA